MSRLTEDAPHYTYPVRFLTMKSKYLHKWLKMQIDEFTKKRGDCRYAGCYMGQHRLCNLEHLETLKQEAAANPDGPITFIHSMEVS